MYKAVYWWLVWLILGVNQSKIIEQWQNKDIGHDVKGDKSNWLNYKGKQSIDDNLGGYFV